LIFDDIDLKFVRSQNNHLHKITDQYQLLILHLVLYPRKTQISRDGGMPKIQNAELFPANYLDR
tara:strand:+ start:204 stop:395 length:192 start_codon:yes stop_codon:yes gene_type:complete